MNHYTINLSHFIVLIQTSIIFIVFQNKAYSQLGYKSAGLIYQSSDLEIEYQLSLRQTNCKNDSIRSLIRLNVIKHNTFTIPKFINWKIEFLNCDEDTVVKQLYKDLTLVRNTQIFDPSMSYIGIKLVTLYSDVTITTKPISLPDKIKKKIILKAPDYISGQNTITTGETVQLTISGGKIPSGGRFVWYQDQCGSKFLGTGNSISVSPNKTTTYFVRAENNNIFSNCTSFNVNIDNNSKPAAEISGTDKICHGRNQPILLSVKGGKLGYLAKWVWYKDSISKSTTIGSGSTIYVQPVITTTYFVRAEGQTNITIPAFKIIELQDSSTSPIQIITPLSICQDTKFNLTVEGGKLSQDASWVWYKQSINLNNKISSGKSNTITINLSESTNIFVRAEGFCNLSSNVSIHINIKKKSDDPVIVETINKSDDNLLTLKVIGGSLGTNANWYWYENNCIGKPISRGELLKKRINKNTKLFVRAEGECNKTICIPFVTPSTLTSKWFQIRYVNFGFTSSSFNKINAFNFTIGSKHLYAKIKIPNTTADVYPSNIIDYILDDNKIINYEGYGVQYYVLNGNDKSYREAYTIGYQFGLSNLKFYVGGGFGSYKHFNGLDNYYYNYPGSYSTDYAKNKVLSTSGLELESGIYLRLYRLNIIMGYNSILSFNHKSFVDASLGIGYVF